MFLRHSHLVGGTSTEHFVQESQIHPWPRYFWKVSRYTSHFYRDTFAKVCPPLCRKLFFTTNCITIRLPFVSQYSCRSIRVRGRWDTPKKWPRKVFSSKTRSETNFLKTPRTSESYVTPPPASPPYIGEKKCMGGGGGILKPSAAGILYPSPPPCIRVGVYRFGLPSVFQPKFEAMARSWRFLLVALFASMDALGGEKAWSSESVLRKLSVQFVLFSAPLEYSLGMRCCPYSCVWTTAHPNVCFTSCFQESAKGGRRQGGPRHKLS